MILKVICTNHDFEDYITHVLSMKKDVKYLCFLYGFQFGHDFAS